MTCLSFVSPRDITTSYNLTPIQPLTVKTIVDSLGSYFSSELAQGNARGAPVPRPFQANLASSLLASLNVESVRGVCHTGLWTLVWHNYALLSIAGSSVGTSLVWNSGGASFLWSGTIGSAAKSYAANENWIQDGLIVYFELTATELIDLAPALRALFSNMPIVTPSYASTAGGSVQHEDGLSSIPNFQYEDITTPPVQNEEYVPYASMWRCSTNVRLLGLSTREEMMPPGSLPLGEAALAASGAPVGGVAPGGQFPATLLATVGFLDADHLNRAMAAIAVALPDGSGCTSGLLSAISRCCSPMWMGLDDSDELYNDSLSQAAVTATGQQGEIFLPQSSRITSTLQRAWKVSARREEVSQVVAIGTDLFLPRDVSSLVANIGFYAKMLSVSVFHSLRVMAIHPSALNLAGPWSGQGVNPRAAIRQFLQVEPGFITEFAYLVQNTHQRLFGMDIPHGFLSTLSYHGSSNPNRPLRPLEGGALPWDYLEEAVHLTPVSPWEILALLLQDAASRDSKEMNQKGWC